MTRENPTLPLSCSCHARGPIIAVRPGQDAFAEIVAIDGRVIEAASGEVPDACFCAACAPWFRREVAA